MDFSWLDGYKSIYRLWATYSAELLEAIRVECRMYEHWNEVRILDRIIKQKSEKG